MPFLAEEDRTRNDLVGREKNITEKRGETEFLSVLFECLETQATPSYCSWKICARLRSKRHFCVLNSSLQVSPVLNKKIK